MKPQVDGVAIDKSKALVFAKSGELLWRSPAWKEPHWENSCDAHLLGRNWTEFVTEKVQSRILRWLLDETETSSGVKPIEFQAMMPETGEMARHVFAKLRYREHWLIIGDRVPLSHENA